MKISPISFRSEISATSNADRAYWHVHENSKLDSTLQKLEAKKTKNRILITLATIGVGALAMVLKFQKKGAALVSNSVVELVDPKKGLNRIAKYADNIAELKEKILYPYKAAMMGDMEPLHFNAQKTGLVLGGKDSKEVQEILKALTEHANELGINVVTCPFGVLKSRIKAQKNPVKSKKAFNLLLSKKVRNWLFKELNKGEIRFKTTGKYTFINMGSIDTFTSKEVLGSDLHALEGLQRRANKQDVKGVCWLSCTEEKGPMDFFFNNSSILVTKLVE